MSFATTVARNVFSNATGFFVNAVVAFLLTPYVERELGSAAWGLWALLVACTGYYGLLDLGIRSAVGQYVTRYWAKDDIDGVSRTLSTSLALMLASGALLLLVTPLVVWLAPSVIEDDELDPHTMRVAFAIVGVGAALNFPLLIFQSATYARQRFDIATGIGIGERLLATAGYVWVLEQGHGLIGVAIVNTVVTLASNLVRLRLAFWLLPGLRLARSMVQFASMRELYGYSIFSVLINAADQIMLNSAAVIIGVVMSATAIAHYNAGAIPISYFLGLVSSIAWVLTPLATAQDSKGDMQTVRGLWLTGTRLILTFAALIGGGLIFMGGDFLGLWMDPKYTSGEYYVSSAWITGVLAVTALVRSATTTGRQICFGMREVRFLARIGFIEAGLTILFCTVLAFTHGILGVAIGTLCSSVIVQLGAMPRFLARRLEVPLLDFFKTVPWAPLAVIATMGVTDWLTEDLLPVTSWGSFLLRAAMLATPAAVVGFALGTTAAERARVANRLLPGRRSS